MNSSVTTKHDKAVLAWGNALAKEGWTVWVHLPDYKQPPQIGGYIPDVYAVKGIEAVAIEIEDADSITSQHTKQQIAAFSAWANASPNRRFFVKGS
ncbi:MAG TPA: hypothetical protein VIJ29_03635 [Candidatus Paceibacterota bacterium]